MNTIKNSTKVNKPIKVLPTVGFYQSPYTEIPKNEFGIRDNEGGTIISSINGEYGIRTKLY